MSQEVFLPRFMVRQGTQDFMVWDRELKRPAVYNGHPAIGVTEWQANEIRIQLTKNYISGG
jgi:hypothetical protein